MRRLAILIALVPALASCESEKKPDTFSKIERMKNVDPMVMAERRAAGRWRSEAGILPGDPKLWVVMDIAGDQSLRVERRGMSTRMETVYAYAKGKVTVKSDGIDGEAPDADGSLKPFRSFTASFPSPAKMLVKSGDQSFVFRYDGN